MYKHRHGLTHTRDVIKKAAVCDGRSGKPVSLIVTHETPGFKVDVDVTHCIVYIQGHDRLTFSFLSSFLCFDWVGGLWSQLVHWAASISPSVPAEAGCLFVVAACVHGVFISGDRL